MVSPSITIYSGPPLVTSPQACVELCPVAREVGVIHFKEERAKTKR